jgi:short-subunit dehydrogenase
MARSTASPSGVLLVTGAGGGIGAAIAELALRNGYRVALADIDFAAVATRARAVGDAALAVELDIRDADAWQRAFDDVESRLGPVDVLVNNAGIIHTGNAATLTFAQHKDIVDVNLLGTIAGVLTALPRMNALGRGHIVNICSMTSFLPLAGYATYGGTKHAMRAFHHSVAIEELGGPVDFTIVHPPSTRTAMLRQEMADPTAHIAFAEKPYAPETIAAAVLRAIRRRSVEVVFPPVAGRIQRVAGVFPRLMRRVIPLVLASGRRKRAALVLQ